MRLHTASHRWLGHQVDTTGTSRPAELALLLAVLIQVGIPLVLL